MNILIVEQSNLFHGIVEEILAQSGIKPIKAVSSAEGLEKLETLKIDFICVGSLLPDSNGLDFARTIRQTPDHKHTPIFLLTSENSPSAYQQALSSGITEVFHKKDIAELANFLNRFIANQQPLSGKVLYVEDSSSQRAMLSDVLTGKGLEVDAFSNAEQAWQAFLENDYDLVITDIVLDGPMTGLSFTNLIRRLDDDKGNVPILAISAFDDISRRIELFYLGINDYINKPIIAEELLARIRNLINTKKFYVEAVKQRKRAEFADESKSQFIAYMSHELRTPLNAILGFSSLLLTDKEHPIADKHTANLEEIRNAGEHLLHLMNDFLDISTIEAGEIRFNITETVLKKEVNQIVARLSGLAAKKAIDIHTVNMSDSVIVQADKFRLQQVLLNLLSNAIKYNNEKGRVQILCKRLSNGYIRLGINDNGIGLDEQQQRQLFLPFNRVGQGNDIEGTGLGLVISKRLIEGMNGEIGFKSTKGVGSTFWIDLPAA